MSLCKNEMTHKTTTDDLGIMFHFDKCTITHSIFTYKLTVLISLSIIIGLLNYKLHTGSYVPSMFFLHKQITVIYNMVQQKYVKYFQISYVGRHVRSVAQLGAATVTTPDW